MYDLNEAVNYYNETLKPLGIAVNKTSLKGPINAKFGILSDSELSELLEVLKPTKAKRITFRSRLQAAYIKQFAEVGSEFSMQEAEDLFDELREDELAKGNKVSNIDRHKDYYLATCYEYGLEIVRILEDRDEQI